MTADEAFQKFLRERYAPRLLKFKPHGWNWVLANYDIRAELRGMSEAEAMAVAQSFLNGGTIGTLELPRRWQANSKKN